MKKKVCVGVCQKVCVVCVCVCVCVCKKKVDSVITRANDDSLAQGQNKTKATGLFLFI